MTAGAIGATTVRNKTPLQAASMSGRPNPTLEDVLGEEFTKSLQGVEFKREALVMKYCSLTETWKYFQLGIKDEVLLFMRPRSVMVVDRIPITEITNVWEGETDDDGTQFCIQTRDEGFNSGQLYRLRSPHRDALEWVSVVRGEMGAAAARERSRYMQLKGGVKRRFESEGTQMGLGVLILLNFVVNIVNSELLPTPGSSEAAIFDAFEVAFTLVFSLELAVNVWVHALGTLLASPANIFDAVVVLASLTQLLFRDVRGMSLFRLVRIFRVLRLFKKFHSLKRIIAALSASMVPMLNAFLVLFLFCSIYAVLAESLYGTAHPVRFGSFSASLFTMFHLCTLDEWSSTVRGLSDDGSVRFGDGVFFISFTILAGIIILNVVVALLLDEFVVRAEKVESEILVRHVRSDFPLDPLMEHLACLKTFEEQLHRVGALFSALDVDQAGALDYASLHRGLGKLAFKPPIRLSRPAFDAILLDALPIAPDRLSSPSLAASARAGAV